MKRAGVYFFFDKDGIVDRYVPYFIQELHKVVDYIVVVANGKLTAESRKTLAAVADDLFVRENRGLDAWAYKEAIEYIGWDRLRIFDELVLTNSTIFGPIYPFQEIFSKMDADPCDFWGMFRLYEEQMKSYFGIHLKWGYKPEYIASNFLVFKHSVLHSFEFRHFWDRLPPINSYFESIVHYEMSISKDLSDMGFVFQTADEGQFQYVCPSSSVYGAYDMITKYRVPIIRRKAFYDVNCPIDFCTDIPRQIMRYIEEHTNYDSNLIWENILRTNNLYDLKNWFNWNQVLSLDYSGVQPQKVKVAVIFHTYYEDIMGQYLHNIEAFPDGTDFYFTTDTEQKQETLKALMDPLSKRFYVEYRLVKNRGRDMSALLVGCRDVVLEGGYDLICFMHDKKGIGNSIEYSCVGQSFSDCCFENVAASREYVDNVLGLFERQPRLGVAVPPPPKNANYYTTIGGYWSMNYQNAVKFLDEMGIAVPIDRKKAPVSAYGSVFWFRPSALKPLFDREWQYEDFDAEPMRGDGTISNVIERVHGFIAQSQGYYTSIIMNQIYAEQEITRITDIAHTYIDFTLQHVGPKLMLVTATKQFSQLLQKHANTNQNAGKKKQGSPSAAALVPALPRQRRGALKGFVRGICPIGLWNLLRRIRCAAAGGKYVEPYVERSAFKTVVRACTPRFLWDELRKAKCRKNGWVYVED